MNNPRRVLTYVLGALSAVLVFGALGVLAWNTWQGRTTQARAQEARRQVVQDFVELGLKHANAGRWDEAIQAFSVAIAAAPEDAAEAYYYRALVYTRLERYGDALEDLNKALEQQPHFPQAYAARGSVYLALGRPASAVEDFKKAIRLGLTDDPTLYINLGQAYFKLDLYDLAEQNFQKALDLDPENPAALFNLGSLYLKKGDDEQALDYFNRTLQKDPNFAAAYFNRAMALAHLGRTQEAIADLEQFLLMPVSHQAQLQAQALLERLRSGKPVDFPTPTGQ